jgi:hypothetical protein
LRVVREGKCVLRVVRKERAVCFEGEYERERGVERESVI